MSETTTKRVIGRHACERCRQAKVRCLLDTFEEYGKCRKCHAAAVACEWKSLATTRVRKRTDARVTDLERQVSFLTAALQNSAATSDLKDVNPRPDLSVETRTTPPSLPELSPSAAPIVSHVVLEDSHSSFSRHTPLISPPSHRPTLDLTTDTKKRLIETFTNRLLPQCPVISILAELSVAQLEESRPFTAGAVFAAACSVALPDAFQTMHDQNIASLSQAVMIEGRKSLDLVQALLVTAIWSHPPQTLNNLNMYQWTHAACTMALELGLGGRSSLHAQRRTVSVLSNGPSEHVMERFRTMFGVYLMCSRLAVSFRRQRMISFSFSTPAAINQFQKHATSINDRRLLAWLRLQSIAEGVESMKENAEMRADPVPIESSSISSDISLFSDRLRTWEDELESALWTASLRIEYGFCKSKLYELTICVGQYLDLPDLAVSTGRTVQDDTRSISPAYIRALLSFVAGCHSILDVFLRSTSDVLQALPMLTVFRAAFAFKALAILRLRSHDTVGQIGQVIDEESLRWQHYSEGVFKSLEKASQGGLYVYPTMALSIRDSVYREQNAGSIEVATSGPPPVEAHIDQNEFATSVTNLDESSDLNYMDALFDPFPISQNNNENNMWNYGFLEFDLFPQ